MFKFIPYEIAKSNRTMTHYDFRPVFSYGCKIVIVIGARRIGKTFGAKKYITKYFIDYGEEFAFLRDNDEARKKLASNKGAKFFADFPKMKNAKFEFGEIDGETVTINGVTAGYLMPSSTFQNYKGNSFDNVKNIVYDEFIAEKNTRHNANRAWEIVNSIFTIASIRNDLRRVIMLANALDRGDPFLQFLGVKIEGYGFYIDKERDIIIHYADDNPEFSKERDNSIMGKLIKGTIFEENLFNNKFTDDAEMFYDKKPPKCKLLVILKSGDDCIRLYDAPDGLVYAEEDTNRQAFTHLRYCSNIDAVDTTYTLANSDMLNKLKIMYNDKAIMFHNAFVKKNFLNFLKKL